MNPVCWSVGRVNHPMWRMPTSWSSPAVKATVADLRWLRDRGLARAIEDHAAAGRTVVGICGGFQMLCRTIDDGVESGEGGAFRGWSLLNAGHRIRFGQDAAALGRRR